jgi:thioredoxin-like negative regulator of GroEL
MNIYAVWLTESGDYATAEPMLRESLALRREVLGPDHVGVASSMTKLADLLIATGRFEEARELAAAAKAICSKTLSDAHWRTADAASAEGAALAGLQQFESAEALLLKSHATLAGDSGALPIVVTNTTRRLAELYSAWGKSAEAARYRAMLN